MTSTKNSPNPLFQPLNGLRSRFQSPVMKAMTFTDSDVGKICLINPEKTVGKIVTRQELLDMDITLVGEWDEISEFDVLRSESKSD